METISEQLQELLIKNESELTLQEISLIAFKMKQIRYDYLLEELIIRDLSLSEEEELDILQQELD